LRRARTKRDRLEALAREQSRAEAQRDAAQGDRATRARGVREASALFTKSGARRPTGSMVSSIARRGEPKQRPASRSTEKSCSGVARALSSMRSSTSVCGIHPQ
jgi:hypothetical protein